MYQNELTALLQFKKYLIETKKLINNETDDTLLIIATIFTLIHNHQSRLTLYNSTLNRYNKAITRAQRDLDNETEADKDKKIKDILHFYSLIQNLHKAIKKNKK